MLHKTIVGLGLAATAIGTAMAEPVNGIYSDATSGDDHGDRTAVEEYGDYPIFDLAWWIEATSTLTDLSADPATDDPNIPNVLVEIVNFDLHHSEPITDLFYVGDISINGFGGNTSFSNQDGFASQGGQFAAKAFRIDAEGANRSLVYESYASDGVLEFGERWRFIVQDYDNDLGVPAHSFVSHGFAEGSDDGRNSAASLVTFAPERDCYGDLDGDYDVDADDFFTYLDEFSRGNTRVCDLDGDGDLDADDFFRYLDYFSRGC